LGPQNFDQLAASTVPALTGPLGLIGTVSALLIFNQPFGFNAILGVIGLAGILMRNTLISGLMRVA
jgi:multidrug efflux pump subunit AcrB